MKRNTILGTVVTAITTLITGCDSGQTTPPLHTFFPTNHWVVKSVVEGEVVVEAVGTNLLEKFRVVRVTPMVPLTNGQPARVELTVRQKAYYQFEFVSGKAYPAID